jgi:hypothetical protein
MEGLYKLALKAYKHAQILNPSDKKIDEGIALCTEKYKAKKEEQIFNQ